MSKPRYKWWGYVKNIIRAYPTLKREYEELHEQSVTANMSGMPGGGNGISRGTEDVATRELPRPSQKEYDAIRNAISITEHMRTGAERLKLINLVFWKNSHTLQGAAMAVNISYDTAIDYHGDFIMTVAYFRDLISYDDLKEHQKFALKSHKSVV